MASLPLDVHETILLILLWVFIGDVLANTQSTWTRKEIHKGWKACRVARDQQDVSLGCSNLTTWNVSTFPITALSVLLEHNQIQIPGELYYSTNLAKIPDISQVGRAFYTLMYEYDLTDEPIDSSSNKKLYMRTTLRFSGINYRASAFLDGQPVEEIDATKNTTTDGMFRRRYFDVTNGQRFHILIEPPLHPGTCFTTNQTHECKGQGGNHKLAKDGPTAQYMLGWDWCQSMPDRATGFFGSVTLETSGPAVILDPAILTISLASHNSNNNVTTLAILARFEYRQTDDNDLPTSGVLTVTSDWREQWQFPVSLESGQLFNHQVVVKNPNAIHLWWPHGVGKEEAHLHSFTFSLQINSNGMISDERQIQVGIRTIETYLDEHTQGQAFRINGQKVYLVGGNWIGTDQALRFSASTKRYCEELALHKHAGLNLIRVWGGGTAERDQFYQCADQLGLLVFQEFWMTGDNNGRWAGNYTWPLNYNSYLTNVQDTILRLRKHASLLFYGGCNECLAPADSFNPPSEIHQATKLMLDRFDPGRFYIPSSMSGPNKADTFQNPKMWRDRSYGLAYADGPYGMLLPHMFFERNPGLPAAYENISIGFQPEIGSSGAPTYRGLLRFMNMSEAQDGFPRRDVSSRVGKAWKFHRHAGWSTKIGETKKTTDTDFYDHVYTYFGSEYMEVNVSDWCMAAQLALHAQYQYLFSGYISHLFDYTSAVIMWKTQSPWPALRGFLYDWYLETTGALRGARAVLANPVSVVFDASCWRIRIVNRQILPIVSTPTSLSGIGAILDWITLDGNIVSSQQYFLSGNTTTVPPMSSAFLGKAADRVKWPTDCTEVCFLRLTPLWNEIQKYNAITTWHWLARPPPNKHGHTTSRGFSALGDMRQRQAGNAHLFVTQCSLDGSGLVVHLQIAVTGDEVLFYPTLSLLETNGKQILPVFDDDETEVVLLPGKVFNRVLKSPLVIRNSFRLETHLESWNGPLATAMAVCNENPSSAAIVSS